MSALEELFAAASAARARAHAPYSRFQVGAAIRCDDGLVHAGCNVENASYPEGWCAETTALGRMISEGGSRTIIEVLVMADGERLCTPCGGCRQRLSEFASPDTQVHIAGHEGLRKSFTLGELLPASFEFGDGS
ncbi:cytidine deaminase [Breoghania sp. L-A4]|uniref:cytidine deaminase n=1 Tax=Breoghania sp. L-A4 TaxID=2304600 RepID=UPI000E360ABD|nr:cytidine deaminase [Breoghania sp. L-A4]AXS39213.1 cytidine deaminase [Breoghania sp. L-A4]